MLTEPTANATARVEELQRELLQLRRTVREQAMELQALRALRATSNPAPTSTTTDLKAGEASCALSQSLSSLYCSSFVRHRPSVAVCLSGIARWLVHSFVYRSLKSHVLDALGVPVTAFARLKLPDSRYVGRRISVSGAAVLRALAFLGIPLERTVLINRTAVDFADCPRYASDAHGHPRRASSAGNASGALCSQAYVTAALGQLESRYYGAKMIESHELRTSTRFDWVLFARPDLLWYRPLRPWCFFAARSSSLRTTSNFDFAFLMPRGSVVAVLQSPYDRYHGCKEDLPRCKTLEHYQRGAWKAHGVYPIQHHPTGLPALVVRPGSHSKTGSYTCERYLSVPEQQPWEPNLLGRRACNAITNFNQCFDLAAAQERGDIVASSPDKPAV